MQTTSQIYLDITLEGGSIAGEAKAGGYEGRIDIDSFQFTANAKEQSLKEVQKGVVANLDLDRVTFSKAFNSSSLKLANALNQHKRFVEARIAIDQQYIEDDRRKFPNETLVITLKNGYVADIHLRTSEGNAGASIKEDITLSFQECEIVYYAETRSDEGKLSDDYRLPPSVFTLQREEQGT